MPEVAAVIDGEAEWAVEELVPFYDAAEAARVEFQPLWRELKLVHASWRPLAVPFARAIGLLFLLLLGVTFFPATSPPSEGIWRAMRVPLEVVAILTNTITRIELLVGAAAYWGGAATMRARALTRLMRNQAFIESRSRFEGAAARYREAVEACVHRLVAVGENATRGRSYDYSLSHGYRKGLAELHDPIFDVETSTAEEVNQLLDGKTMPGGTIGLSGSRGTGKTTIIRRHCLRRWGDDNAVRTLVSVPVNYDAREFFLHLFAEICRAVRGDVEFEEAQPTPRSIGWQIAVGLIRALGAACLATLYVNREALVSDPPLATIGVALFLTVFGVFTVTAPATLLRRAIDPGPGPEQRLVDEAATWLEVIRYQKSVDHKWEGGFKPPGGFQFGRSHSSTLTLQPLTLPEILARLNDFVGRLTIDRHVYIGIDELDKLDSADAAAAFLNNLKGLFGQRNAFFLVSVSDQAMGQFEGRRRGIRTVFDSSLDRIVHVPPMTYEVAGKILDRRITALPVPFIALAYVLSSGVPRDLIRSTRLITEAPATLGEDHPHLRSVLEVMAATELRNDARAIRALLEPGADPDGSLALSFENAIPKALTAESLRARAADLLAQAFQSISGPDSATRAGRSGGVHAQAQFAATLYAWSACFHYFSTEPGAGALPAPEDQAAEDHPLELLAAARRGLADGAHVCWKRTSDYYLTAGVDSAAWPGDEIAESPEDLTTA